MNSEDICSIVNQVSSCGDYRYNLSLGKLLFNIRCIIGTEKFQTVYWFVYFIREVSELNEF